MGLEKDKSAVPSEVTSIRNDYIRSMERQEKRQQAHKVRLYRRLTVFGLLVLMASIWIGTTMYAQSQAIAEKEQTRAESLAALEQVQKEQVQLEEQITLLNDEEYIAKLARKEYFLSDEGEIIFTLPNKEGENNEETAEKE